MKRVEAIARKILPYCFIVWFAHTVTNTHTHTHQHNHIGYRLAWTQSNISPHTIFFFHSCLLTWRRLSRCRSAAIVLVHISAIPLHWRTISPFMQSFILCVCACARVRVCVCVSGLHVWESFLSLSRHSQSGSFALNQT